MKILLAVDGSESGGAIEIESRGLEGQNMEDLVEETDKCANHACNCLVSAGNQFCCERCERMENDLETGHCRCEHVECYEKPIL